MTSKNKIIATLADSSVSDGYTLLDFRVTVADNTGATGTTAGGATGPTGSIAAYDPTYIAIPWTGVTGSGPDPGDDAFVDVEFDKTISTDSVFDLIRDRIVETYGRNTTDGEASKLSNGQSWAPSGAGAWPNGPQGPNGPGVSGNAYRLRFDADEILVRGWGHRGKKGDENPSRVLYKGDPIRPPRVPIYNNGYTIGTNGADSGISPGKGRILIYRTQETVRNKSLTASTMTCKLHFKSSPSIAANTRLGEDWEYRLYAFNESTVDFDTTTCIWSTPIGTPYTTYWNGTDKVATSAPLDLFSSAQSAITAPARVVFVLGVRRITSNGPLKASHLGRLVRVALVYE